MLDSDELLITYTVKHSTVVKKEHYGPNEWDRVKEIEEEQARGYLADVISNGDGEITVTTRPNPEKKQ